MFTITIPQAITIPTWAIVIALAYLLWIIFFNRLWERFWNLYRVQPEGFVYLMRRADGLYKIGCTNNLKERGETLSKQYRQPVKLVQSWAVPNVQAYEARALALTRRFAVEDTELRTMSFRDAMAFVFVFSLICEKMATPGKVMTIWRG